MFKSVEELAWAALLAFVFSGGIFLIALALNIIFAVALIGGIVLGTGAAVAIFAGMHHEDQIDAEHYGLR